MVFIVHISDFHVGSISFQEDLLLQSVDIINDLAPDVTIMTGDLTENGYYIEMEQAAKYLEMIKSPLMVVPGNHDARSVSGSNDSRQGNTGAAKPKRFAVFRIRST